MMIRVADKEEEDSRVEGEREEYHEESIMRRDNCSLSFQPPVYSPKACFVDV